MKFKKLITAILIPVLLDQERAMTRQYVKWKYSKTGEGGGRGRWINTQ